MIHSRVLSSDPVSCPLDYAVIRVLAIQLQLEDLDGKAQSYLDSLKASVSVDWGASMLPPDSAKEGMEYDLILLGPASHSMAWDQAATCKQDTGAGLVIFLEPGSPETRGVVQSPIEGGVWSIPDWLFSSMLPWVLAHCGERKRLLTEQARLAEQLHGMQYRLEMADMASTVLHNVGNVLNSVNVAGKVLEDLATQSSVVLINRISDLLKAHEQDWMTFLSEDPKGQKILPFLTKVGPSLVVEQQTFLKELQGLQRHLSHVRHIILSHQEMARVEGQVKPVAIADLLEQALELSFHPGDARWVTIQRDFSPVPPVLAEEHQVLQILVNLFRNAKQAMQQHDQPRHTLTLSVRPQIHESPSQVAVSIQDTGMGIAPEHVSCMFRRGFTTKKDGNGIGLHSSAMTLEKLGGSLSVQSAGVGLGATFTLTIPVAGEDDASGD